MKDIPIIFSAPMVLALLRQARRQPGGKTMTRRIAWKFSDVNDNHTKTPTPWQKVQPGDRLWVREAFANHKEKISRRQTVDWTHYRATDAGDFLPTMKWKPSIHMPRALSRLTLTVTATWIESLQKISPNDCIAEGIEEQSVNTGAWIKTFRVAEFESMTARGAFRGLWESLHGKPSWDENPEVVVLTFSVAERNIDAEKAA